MNNFKKQQPIGAIIIPSPFSSYFLNTASLLPFFLYLNSFPHHQPSQNGKFSLYTFIYMKNIIFYYPLLLLFLASLTFAYKNTTDFWKSQLNTEIHFQAYSGYQSINWYFPNNQAQLFYQMFSAYHVDPFLPSSSTPLIIWLQGGPGSSSQLGAFTELGPIRINNGVPQLFEHSWNKHGHLLFIDSPLNAGFSFYGDREGKKQVSTTGESTDHLMNFLYNFYSQFPSLKASPLYITGESYAGHYVPNLAARILSNTTFAESMQVTLKGIGIGDGWTDPINQVNFYDSYLWSVGIVSNKFRDVCTWYQTKAIMSIYEGNYQNATAYFDFLTSNKTTAELYMGNITVNNFRQQDRIDGSFATFVQNHKEDLGAKVDFMRGNAQIYAAFAQDISKSYTSDLIKALRSIKVLIYNGQNDVIVNSAGVLHYINSLNWEGIGGWKRRRKQIWRVGGEVLGWTKIEGNLWYCLVNGAGHLVPRDRPETAELMLNNFVEGRREWGE